MKQIKEIHAHHLRKGSLKPQVLLQKLLKIPNLTYSSSLLSSLPLPPSTFLFNTLLQALSRRGPFFHCILLLPKIPHPNTHTFTFLFSACATFRQPVYGRALHGRFLSHGFKFDLHVVTSVLNMYSVCGLLKHAHQMFDEMPDRDVAFWNALIRGYMKVGELAKARELFDAMPVRNVVSWTTMVSGYTQTGLYEDSIDIFLRMWDNDEVAPNEVTIASVLPACASVGAMGLGEKIEEYARGKGYIGNLFVTNALLEMYGKCGSIEKARRVFEEIGTRRNLCSWNSMIMALAVHGRCDEALELFREMKARGLTPDDITFVGVLLACTHGGLVSQGQTFFRSMQHDFSITPKLQHYGCMVDLLGRSGLLTEAYNLIRSMPIPPDAVIWGALLGACSFHGEVELAEIAANFLFKLEPANSGNYVILANVYAVSGKWDSVAEVWKLMKGKKQRKEAGYSVVELEGVMHKFLVEDKSHPRSEAVYVLLKEMRLVMKGEADLEIEGICKEVLDPNW